MRARYRLFKFDDMLEDLLGVYIREDDPGGEETFLLFDNGRTVFLKNWGLDLREVQIVLEERTWRELK